MITDRGDPIQILRMAGELDLATADTTAAQARAALASRTRLLLLDLTGLAFCDARGLSALVRIANHADKTGCRYGLIAPQPLVARILRITHLDPAPGSAGTDGSEPLSRGEFTVGKQRMLGSLRISASSHAA
jgi:anti-sigma B factor antagonist